MNISLKIKRMLPVFVYFLAAVCSFSDDLFDVTVEVMPGDNYGSTKWFGIIPVKMVPQMAFWIETEDGEFAASIYSTKRNAQNDWRGADARPEALPVYNAARGRSDAVTGASPKGKGLISLDGGNGIPSGRYFIYAEVNKSFDYNECYTEENSGVNGQPSLVYRGELQAGPSSEEVRVILLPYGTGSVDGRSGMIRPGTEGLTTGLSIIKSAAAVVRSSRN